MAESYMRPVRFWEEYVTAKDGKTVQTREMVELAHPNMQSMSTNIVWIREATKSARDWEAIAPYYEAWRKGQDAPVTGTPLGAWPGITPEQAEVFKAAGIRTVEDVSMMNDRVMGMVKLPNIRRFKMEAGQFLEASDTRAAQMKLAAQDEKIRALEDLVKDMADRNVTGQEEAPKRRGRKPKALVEAEAEQTQEADEE